MNARSSAVRKSAEAGKSTKTGESEGTSGRATLFNVDTTKLTEEGDNADDDSSKAFKNLISV
jgi:hypothetical protein